MRNLNTEINTGMNVITVSRCMLRVYRARACLGSPILTLGTPMRQRLTGILSMAAYGVSTEQICEGKEDVY